MDNDFTRIVSLLPATTEIVAALGCKDQLVGCSHECDMPTSVLDLPACTQPKFNPDGQSYRIDQRIKVLLQEGLSIYRIDAPLLASLKPDLIITQNHCEVCAASLDEVRDATENYLQSPVDIISVSPTNLCEVYTSITKIAEALNKQNAGKKLCQSMRDDFKAIQKIAQRFSPKTLLCIEWLNPLMVAGNWVPELAQIAGATTLAAKSGKYSPWVDWKEIVQLDPDVLCIMPCGYSIKETLAEMDLLTNYDEWNGLRAVQNNRVYIADGHQYFNRPGPRLTDSARILAEVVHPELAFSFKDFGWINM